MRNAIVTQCVGAAGWLAFSNGLMLVYLMAIGVSAAQVAGYLSIMPLITGLLVVPAAFFADRHGKKRIAYIGSTTMAIGFLVAALSGSFVPPMARSGALLGIALFAFGYALFTSSWFALLSPIVPETLRGRFFGRLRFSWQLCGIAFAGICAVLLSEESSIAAYQFMLGAIALLLFVRIFFFSHVPEMERERNRSHGFVAAVRQVAQNSGFMSFCAYVFLLTMFTAGGPIVFGLIEKKALGFGDDMVVWFGSLTMAGSVIGFFIGGKLVDRRGTRPTFLMCHFAYGAILLMFVFRDFAAIHVPVSIGTLHLLFGVTNAASSIAISTELLALLPATNKALASSVCSALLTGGVALSGIIVSVALSLGLLNDTWILLGHVMTSYDAILLAYGSMVVMLVVTLGLVPSVLHKAQWVPHR